MKFIQLTLMNHKAQRCSLLHSNARCTEARPEVWVRNYVNIKGEKKNHPFFWVHRRNDRHKPFSLQRHKAWSKTQTVREGRHLNSDTFCLPILNATCFLKQVSTKPVGIWSQKSNCFAFWLCQKWTTVVGQRTPQWIIGLTRKKTGKNRNLWSYHYLQEQNVDFSLATGFQGDHR